MCLIQDPEGERIGRNALASLEQGVSGDKQGRTTGRLCHQAEDGLWAQRVEVDQVGSKLADSISYAIAKIHNPGWVGALEYRVERKAQNPNSLVGILLGEVSAVVLRDDQDLMASSSQFDTLVGTQYLKTAYRGPEARGPEKNAH